MPPKQLPLFGRQFTPAEARAFLEAKGIGVDTRVEECSNGSGYRKWRFRRGTSWIAVKRADVANIEQAQRVLRAARALLELSPEEREALTTYAKTGTDPK